MSFGGEGGGSRASERGTRSSRSRGTRSGRSRGTRSRSRSRSSIRLWEKRTTRDADVGRSPDALRGGAETRRVAIERRTHKSMSRRFRDLHSWMMSSSSRSSSSVKLSLSSTSCRGGGRAGRGGGGRERQRGKARSGNVNARERRRVLSRRGATRGCPRRRVAAKSGDGARSRGRGGGRHVPRGSVEPRALAPRKTRGAARSSPREKSEPPGCPRAGEIARAREAPRTHLDGRGLYQPRRPPKHRDARIALVRGAFARRVGLPRHLEPRESSRRDGRSRVKKAGRVKRLGADRGGRSGRPIVARFEIETEGSKSKPTPNDSSRRTTRPIELTTQETTTTQTVLSCEKRLGVSPASRYLFFPFPLSASLASMSALGTP